jgi:hypothetical protein
LATSVFCSAQTGDLTFKVSCHESHTRLAGATVKIRINEKTLVPGESNANGFVTFKGLRRGDKVAIIAYKDNYAMAKLQLTFDPDVECYWIPLEQTAGSKHKGQDPPHYGNLKEAIANPDCGK